MTTAMWLTWLLRGDIRAGSDIHDLEAQRSFVAWWLLFGKLEYPKIWWYGPDQVEVAMEPSPDCPAGLPRLLARLHQARWDIQQAFDLSNTEAVADYLCWYRLNGPLELEAAPLLAAEHISITEAASSCLPEPCVSRLALALWHRSDELRAVIDPRKAGDRRGLEHWYSVQAARHIPLATPLPPETGLNPFAGRGRSPRGTLHVSLVGFARAEFGIGEDVRMVSRALEAASVEHSIADLRPGTTIRLGDESRRGWIGPAAGPARLNIFCLTGFDMGQLLLEQGSEPFQGIYNIGYWPWELPRFPDDWADVYGLVDEIWASTTFQAAAYTANSPVPVHLMPPAVTPPATLRRVCFGSKRSRAGKQFTFIYPFDPNSTLARKNPIAAVKAFRTAFPADDRSVRLVLRVNGIGAGHPGWRELKAGVAGDKRIHIVEGTLSRVAAQRMLQTADCLVSPHRAEGLGRNIGEAIALGVPVLATGFSGSGDLLEKNERIASKPRRVRPEEYPHAEGLWWSEPDWRHLARQMNRIRRLRAGTMDTVYIRRSRRFLRHFSISVAGERYKAAIARILNELAGRAPPPEL